MAAFDGRSAAEVVVELLIERDPGGDRETALHNAQNRSIFEYMRTMALRD
jgi:hypothetical protein